MIPEICFFGTEATLRLNSRCNVRKRRIIQLQRNPCSFQFSNIYFFFFESRSDTEHPECLPICREFSSKWFLWSEKNSKDLRLCYVPVRVLLNIYRVLLNIIVENSQEACFSSRNTFLIKIETFGKRLKRFTFYHVWLCFMELYLELLLFSRPQSNFTVKISNCIQHFLTLSSTTT